MQVALRDSELPARLILDSGNRLSDEKYAAFCHANPDLRVERTSEGVIVIVPPAGGESSYRSARISGQLDAWAEGDGRGRAFDSSVQFFLPNGDALSPDAAWVSNGRLSKLTKKQRQQFLRLCPEFIVEVMSPSDRLRTAKQKMEVWMSNGVELAWLIDGDAKVVYVYRAGQAPEKKPGVPRLAGEGSVDGFVLNLERIWAGL